MEITLKANYGFDLIFEDTNIKVSEDIEERIYEKDENGKNIITIPPFRDISTDTIEKYCSLLDQIVCYRKREFDSSDLITALFSKMPQEKAVELIKEQVRNFEIEL